MKFCEIVVNGCGKGVGSTGGADGTVGMPALDPGEDDALDVGEAADDSDGSSSENGEGVAGDPVAADTCDGV